MTAGDGRKALHAYVTTGAHNAWHDACAEEGVSVSAVLETLGSNIGELLTDELVRTARRVDAERRRRHPARG